jgi:tetratricopeptide (TPR) repeat protein
LIQFNVRMRGHNVSFGVAVFFAALVPGLVASPQAAQTQENQRATARHGIQLLMDGDMDGAAQIFRQIEQADPESALGYVLEADAYWWKIYLTEANLVDPDVFEALSEALTPYDAEFHRLDSLAIEKAEAQIRAHPDDAWSQAYEGLAYALLARLEALRDHALATARAGKKMRNLSLQAVKLNPNLYDAYLGTGIYNYFEATLPTYVRMLRFLIRLPGGDRARGLEQLQTAADKGEIVVGEARFHLAKNYSRSNERQYAKSLELLQAMQRDYPHNPLWKLLVGSLEIRMGQAEQGEALYREVIRETEDPASDVWKPLHRQAQKALDRRHGKEQ